MLEYPGAEIAGSSKGSPATRHGAVQNESRRVTTRGARQASLWPRRDVPALPLMTDRQMHPLDTSRVQALRETEVLQGGLESSCVPRHIPCETRANWRCWALCLTWP